MGCCFLLADGDASVMIDTGMVGEPIFIAQDLDDAGKALAAEQLEESMNACERRAEALLRLV